MISQVRKTEIILGNAIKECQKEELEMRKISRKSMTLNKDVKMDEILKAISRRQLEKFNQRLKNKTEANRSDV